MLRTMCSQVFVFLLALAMLPGCVQSKSHVAQRHMAQKHAAPPEKLPHLDKSQLADLHMTLGRGLENQGEFDKAAKLYSDVLARGHERADACARLAILADKKGRFAESRNWHRKALELQPDNPDWHCNLGYSLYLQEDWEPAQESLARALQLNPEHVRAHNNMGLVLARMGQAEEAIAEFRQAGCSEADAHNNLAHGLALSGKLDLARRHYQFALKCNPNSVNSTRGLESINQLLARRAAAREAAPSEAAASDPASSEEESEPAADRLPMVPVPDAAPSDEDPLPALPTLPTPGKNWPPSE